MNIKMLSIETKDLVEEYIFKELNNYNKLTKKSHINSINSFFSVHKKPSFNEQDILTYLNSPEFNALSPSSQNLYKLHLKRFFRWYGIKNIFLENNIKKRREKQKQIRKEDLISLREVRKMLKNTNDTQSKCLIILMYETAGRIDEIRNVRIRDIAHYESYASIFFRVSKTIARSIPIIYSIPFLSQWLNNHPYRDNKDAYLFVRLYRGKFSKYSTTGLYVIIKSISKFLNKNAYPHLFRHSRLTELAKYLTEAELCRFAGWTIGSRQSRRYVHLSQEDVENKILSIHGIKKLKELKTVELIKTIKCSVCTYENSNVDRYCSRCGSVLDIKTVIKHQQEARKIDQIYDADEIKDYIDKLFEEKD